MENDFADLTLFITGPTYVREEIKKAAMLPDFGHRDKEAKKRLEPAINNLKRIMGVEGDDNYKLFLIPGTGSSAMEASIKSLVSDDETVLCVSVGAFGKLYYKIASSNKNNVELLEFAPGQAIDHGVLREKLESLKPAVVTITHNETSTGVINDVAALGKLIREHNALPLVDGVSILGGAPSDIKEGNIAFYCGSTQKCLGLPAGFGIGVMSEDALEKAEKVGKRGYNTDLIAHVKKGEKFQTLTTTPTSLANQLYFQTNYIVEEEGIENRFKRHMEMKEIVHKFIEAELPGFQLLPEKENASPSLTCIKVPASFTIDMLKDVKEELRKDGYLMDPGYGKMNKALAEQGRPLTIRVAHMGDITPEMLNKYLTALKDALMKHIGVQE